MATVNTVLEDGQAGDIAVIELAGKTTIADYMVVATGNPRRHLNALADNLIRKLKEDGYGTPGVEGRVNCDWVLVDAGDVIVHLFRPDIRAFYNLEKMWSAPPSKEKRGDAMTA